MDNNNSQKNKFSFHNVLLAVVFFIIGYFSYNHIQSIKHERPSQENFDLFWEVWSTIEKKYPFEEPTDQEKIYGAIEGLVNSYHDDYSAFLPPVTSQFFDETISGEFGGIGAEIGIRNGYLTVISPLKDSPAELSGLESGDIITHVDGLDITGKTLDEAISYIRGEINTEVTLTIVRFDEAEAQDIDITRDVVTIPVLDTEVIDGVFIIHSYNFNETVDNRFKDALTEFKEGGYSKLLIDLRNNPGGFLSSSVTLASYFLPQGTVVLREQFGIDLEEETIYRSFGYDLLNDHEYETVVLINQGSASASEIVAGALRDNNVATIVGETSYGKGSVQELINLPNKTSLKVTVARWLTPNKEHISEIGIEPDVYIESNQSFDTDIQLQEAITMFKEK